MLQETASEQIRFLVGDVRGVREVCERRVWRRNAWNAGIWAREWDSRDSDFRFRSGIGESCNIGDVVNVSGIKKNVVVRVCVTVALVDRKLMKMRMHTRDGGVEKKKRGWGRMNKGGRFAR